VPKRINIILDDQFYELLRNEAFANRTSMTKIINQLLKRHYELPNNATSYAGIGRTSVKDSGHTLSRKDFEEVKNSARKELNKPFTEKLKEQIIKKSEKGDMPFT
jgi:hypothetical protein